TELRRELDPEVAEPAEPEDGDGVTAACERMPERIEGGDAGAHERPCLRIRQPCRHARQRLTARDHVLGVSTVRTDAADQLVPAGDERPLPARLADEVVPAVPPHPDPVSWLPALHPGTDPVDDTDHLVSRHPGKLQTRELPALHEAVAVTDSAGGDPDLHLSRSGRRSLSRDEFEIRTG